MSGLNATFGPNTKIGILYHISNVGGTTINPNPATFDVTLTFQDGAATTVRVRGTDWFGGASAGPYNQLLPDASSNLPAGLEVQAHPWHLSPCRTPTRATTPRRVR